MASGCPTDTGSRCSRRTAGPASPPAPCVRTLRQFPPMAAGFGLRGSEAAGTGAHAARRRPESAGVRRAGRYPRTARAAFQRRSGPRAARARRRGNGGSLAPTSGGGRGRGRHRGSPGRRTCAGRGWPRRSARRRCRACLTPNPPTSQSASARRNRRLHWRVEAQQFLHRRRDQAGVLPEAL